MPIMKHEDAKQQLHAHGIKPSAQRLAIASFVLDTNTHPTADRVWHEVHRTFPMVSRATVYNTLNLLVVKGLLRQFVLDDGKTVFDPHVDGHHHFIDEESGTIHDVPWDAVQVANVDSLREYDVRDYMVIMRGRKRPRKSLKSKRRNR